MEAKPNYILLCMQCLIDHLDSAVKVSTPQKNLCESQKVSKSHVKVSTNERVT